MRSHGKVRGDVYKRQVCALAAVYMYKTKIGMNLKAVGESNAAGDASGINVALYKYVHILIGGALCGLGGAYLSLVRIWTYLYSATLMPDASAAADVYKRQITFLVFCNIKVDSEVHSLY